MGGGLAVGCGGVARSEAPDSNGDGGSGASSGGVISLGGASRAGTGNGIGSASGVGGSFIALPAGGATNQGAAGADASAYYKPSCPYAQWDCRSAPNASACFFELKSKDDPIAAGCVCDTSRPTSAADCNADESFVCRQARPPYEEMQPWPSTWDGTLHVQCACIPLPTPTYESCSAVCAKTYGANGATQCSLPADSACDERGVCTATSADVLRQDGIMCGCADIGLI